MYKCPFCDKRFEKKSSISGHANSCKNNPNRTIPFSNINRKCDERTAINNQINKDPERILRRNATLSKRCKEGLIKLGGHPHSEETKELIRQQVKERYANGWEPTCGRCKKYDYESPIAGSIKVDGQWKLRVARYLDSLNVRWKRNKRRFEYQTPQGKTSTYCPDFFVEDWNTYIEVKGYKTDLDECKWRQFSEPLEVWDKKKLIELNIL